jgi:hypothetical protein
MSAVVSSTAHTCTIVRGVGTTGTAFVNFCNVLFNQTVTSCTYSVTLASTLNGYPGADDTGEVWAFNDGAKGVLVRTADSSGFRVPKDFHLLVFCPPA